MFSKGVTFCRNYLNSNNLEELAQKKEDDHIYIHSNNNKGVCRGAPGFAGSAKCFEERRSSERKEHTVISTGDVRIRLITDITQKYAVKERVNETNQETECVKKRQDQTF